MRDKDLASQIRGSLQRLLEQVPLARIKTWRKEIGRKRGLKGDVEAEVLVGGESWRLLIELKSSGEPRYVRSAVQQLREWLSGERKAYGVVAAPYLSAEAGLICREEGVGYLDLAGNCRLNFANLFIERQGVPKPASERRPLRTLFAPKASRLLRLLLEEPGRGWTLQALAEKARVSLGLSFKVKQRLLDLELAAETDRGLRLTRPEGLLLKWAENYSFTKNEALDYYAQREPSEMEAALSEYGSATRTEYAFTLFSGAARAAPYARYLKGAAYVTGEPAEIAKRLSWKPVPSGANFTLLKPYDEGVFFGRRRIDGDSVVSDVQLYLDLVGSKTRGEEAAIFLLEQRLRPKW